MHQTIEKYMQTLDITVEEILNRVDQTKLAFDRTLNLRNQNIVRIYFQDHIDVETISRQFGITRNQIVKILKKMVGKVYLSRDDRDITYKKCSWCKGSGKLYSLTCETLLDGCRECHYCKGKGTCVGRRN